jgi:hypothetical protein
MREYRSTRPIRLLFGQRARAVVELKNCLLNPHLGAHVYVREQLKPSSAIREYEAIAIEGPRNPAAEELDLRVADRPNLQVGQDFRRTYLWLTPQECPRAVYRCARERQDSPETVTPS